MNLYAILTLVNAFASVLSLYTVIYALRNAMRHKFMADIQYSMAAVNFVIFAVNFWLVLNWLPRAVW